MQCDSRMSGDKSKINFCKKSYPEASVVKHGTSFEAEYPSYYDDSSRLIMGDTFHFADSGNRISTTANGLWIDKSG